MIVSGFPVLEFGGSILGESIFGESSLPGSILGKSVLGSTLRGTSGGVVVGKGIVEVSILGVGGSIFGVLVLGVVGPNFGVLVLGVVASILGESSSRVSPGGVMMGDEVSLEGESILGVVGSILGVVGSILGEFSLGESSLSELDFSGVVLGESSPSVRPGEVALGESILGDGRVDDESLLGE